MIDRPDDNYAAAVKLADSHHCPDCQGKSRLTVRMVARQAQAWCPRCKRVDGFRRRESLTALWRRDPEAVPYEIADKLERKYHMKPLTGQELAVANETTMMQRIEQARWLKALAPEDRNSLAHLSVQYGFDPLMKELIIYEGSPYITVQGLIRKAHEQKMFAGLEDRPMTEEERKQYGYKAPVCWIVKAYRKDWRVPAVGTGQANPERPFRNNMIEKDHPEWMARSRAMRQALKLAFPHSLPFDQMESAEESGIDPETGEILDGYTEPIAFPASEAPDDVEEAEFSEAPSTTIPEPQDEASHKQDMRERITAKIRAQGLTKKRVEEMSLEHGGTIFAELSLDGLVALSEALAEKAS